MPQLHRLSWPQRFGISLPVLLTIVVILKLIFGWAPYVAPVVAAAVTLVWGVVGFCAWLVYRFLRAGTRGRSAIALTVGVPTIVVVGFAWSCLRQKWAIDAILDAKGSVEFANNARLDQFSRGRRYVLEPYLVRVVGASVRASKNPGLAARLAAFPNLKELRVTLPDGKDAVVLARLPHLIDLNISVTRNADAAFPFIGQLSELKQLDVFSNVPVTDAAAEHLAENSKLEILTIHPAAFTDKGVQRLSRLKLHFLDIDGSPITDEGLRRLHAMPLYRLSVLDSRVTNQGLQTLKARIPAIELLPAALPQSEDEADVVRRLEKLGFKLTAGDHGRITAVESWTYLDPEDPEQTFDAICQLLSELPQLKKFTLHDVKATEPGMRALSTTGQLEELILTNAEIDDDRFKLIANLTSLRELNLIGSPITDDGLAAMAKMTNLELVYLSDCQIQGEGLAHWANLQKLTNVSFNGCPLEDVGLKHLAAVRSLQWLDVSRTKVTNKGLLHLAKLPKLGAVHVDDTNVTDEGYAAFLEAR